MATKSKMRIYGGRGYSDQMVDLYMTVDMEGNAYLHADYLFQKTWVEHIRIPADDILEALQPLVNEIVYEHVQRALSND